MWGHNDLNLWPLDNKLDKVDIFSQKKAEDNIHQGRQGS